MGAGGHPAAAYNGDGIASRNSVAHLGQQLAAMGIDCLQPFAMVNFDGIAAAAAIF